MGKAVIFSSHVCPFSVFLRSALCNGGHALWLRWQFFSFFSFFRWPLPCCLYVSCSSLMETLSPTRAEAGGWVFFIRPHDVFTRLEPHVCSHTRFQFTSPTHTYIQRCTRTCQLHQTYQLGGIDQSWLGNIYVWYLHIRLHILML